MCQSKYIRVQCKSCEKQFMKRKDSIKEWQGNCIPCGRKLIANKPHVKKMFVERNSGEKSNFWQGGISTKNMIIRASKQYREWRRKVMERDDFTCQMCDIRGSKLHVDHIKPFSKYPELRFNMKNARTLCVPCHRKTPTWGINQFSINWESI